MSKICLFSVNLQTLATNVKVGGGGDAWSHGGKGGGGGGQEEEFWASLSSVNIYFTIQHLATWMCLMVKTLMWLQNTLPFKKDNFIPSDEDDFIHPVKMTTAHFAVAYSCISAPPAAE